MMRKSVCGERGCRGEEEEHMSLIWLHRLLHDRPLDYQWWGEVQAGDGERGCMCRKGGCRCRCSILTFGNEEEEIHVQDQNR